MTILISRKEIAQTKKIIASEISKLQKAIYDEEMQEEEFDLLGTVSIDYPAFHRVIGLDHSDIGTFTPLLAHKLKELLALIGVEELIIIAHLRMDFFSNTHSRFKSLVNAYRLLEQIVGAPAYKEAFVINLDRLPEFIEILFWITRCNPAAPEYIFLFDKEEKVQIQLCKYGNIHLTQFGSEKLTAPVLASKGWRVIEGREFDNFTDDGRIEGRKLGV